MIGLPKVITDRIRKEGVPELEKCAHCGTMFMPYDLLARDRTDCPHCHKAQWRQSSTPDMTIPYEVAHVKNTAQAELGGV